MRKLVVPAGSVSLEKNVSGSFGEVFFDVRCMCEKIIRFETHGLWKTWLAYGLPHDLD